MKRNRKKSGTIISFDHEKLSREDAAMLVMEVVDSGIISWYIAFVLIYKLGLISRNLFLLFSKYEPLKADIPEFTAGFLKTVVENAQGHF